MASHLDAGEAVTLQIFRNQGGTRYGERAEDAPSFLADSHQLPHQVSGLCNELMLVGLA